jgi:nucleotide-binding universal stress UspA family protein
MKDVLAVLTPSLGDDLGQGANYALALASVTRSHLTLLITEIERGHHHGLQGEPDNMQGGTEMISPQSIAERFVRTANLCRSAADQASVSCTVLPQEERTVAIREALIEHAQVRDVVVLDVLGPLHYPRQDVVEAVLFNSGRPIILVPAGAHPFREQSRALFAWDATRSAVRALHDALPLLMRAQEVLIVSVTDDKELRAPRSGEDLCRYLARWSIDARFEPVERKDRTVGATLHLCALQTGAELLVMGGFAHAREREFMFGSATRDIFQSTLEIPILLSH